MQIVIRFRSTPIIRSVAKNNINEILKILIAKEICFLIFSDIGLIFSKIKQIDESKIVVLIPIMVPIECATVICVP